MSKAESEFKFTILKDNKESQSPVWDPQTYWQFHNFEARELYKKDPTIVWHLPDRAKLFFSQGLRPNEFKSNDPDWWGQGYVIEIDFVKTENGKLGGVIELIPTCNNGDNLPGTTADGKEFIYNGSKFGVKTAESLSGSTGGAHKIGRDQLLEAQKRSGTRRHAYKYNTMGGGGLFVGSTDLLGDFRINSGILNAGTFPINPLFKLLNCTNDEREKSGSDFWFKRIMPEISQSLLEFLLQELPLKDKQQRKTTNDSRTDSDNIRRADRIKLWKSMSPTEMKIALEERLIYFAEEEKVDSKYSVASVIKESQQQGILLDVNFKEQISGRTALSYCLEKKASSNSDIQALIEAGADFFQLDEAKKMPIDYDTLGLGFACIGNMINDKQKNVSAVEKLKNLLIAYISKGLKIEDIKINQQDPQTKEALIFTIIATRPQWLHTILEHLTPNLEIKNNSGHTPFDVFLTKKTIDKTDSANWNTFVSLKAPFTHDWQEISPQFHGYMGKELLAEAKQNKFEKFFQLKGFDVNYSCPSSGLTLLHLAVTHLNLEAATLLLQKGANPNLPDNSLTGSTALGALIQASKRQEDNPKVLEMLKLLLKANADPHLENNLDKTPYQGASAKIKAYIDQHQEKPTASSNKQSLFNSSSPPQASSGSMFVPLI